MGRLQFLKSLTAISPGMRFNKVGEKVVISQKNENIGFIYSFPNTDFKFEGKVASFIDYKEFVSILNMLSATSDMTQDKDNHRYITFTDPDQNIKISYTLSNDTIDLSTGPLDFTWGSTDAFIDFEPSEFTKIKRFISAISAEKIRINIAKGVCTLTCFRDKKGDNIEIKYAVDSQASFEYVITADFFTLVPEGTARLNLKKEGMLQLSYKFADDVSLSVITGIIEE